VFGRRKIVLGSMLSLTAGVIAIPLQAQAQDVPVAATNNSANAVVAQAAAQKVVDARSPELRLGRYEKLTPTGVQSGGNGTQYVSFVRTFKGLPVIGGDAVVVTDPTGKVLEVASAQKSPINLATATPKVSTSAATATARGQLSAVTSSTTPQMEILTGKNGAHLVWESLVTGTSEAHGLSKLHVFVDAATGAVDATTDEVHSAIPESRSMTQTSIVPLQNAGAATGVVNDATGHGFYNGTVNFSTSGSAAAFLMQDPARGVDLTKSNLSELNCGRDFLAFTDPDDDWGNGRSTDLVTACVDEQYAIQHEYDMLGSWLGRDGFDGSGFGGPSATVGLSNVGASYDDTLIDFGFSGDGQRNLVSQDVVGSVGGFEVFDHTPGGFGIDNENAGLVTGTGDIFGALTEAYVNNPKDVPDFTFAELDNVNGQGPVRYMYDPSKTGLASCYSSAISNDDAFTAGGPLDHWFYLLSQGSAPAGGPNSPICSGGAASVTGQGIKAAGQVYYNAMLAKTSTWSYSDVRIATLNAAKNLFPSSCSVFNSVKAAWNAVAVPAQPTEPVCSPIGNTFALNTSAVGVNILHGTSTSLTVSTSVVSGTPERVTLSAQNVPAGTTVSFSPATVTAGQSSIMTVNSTTATAEGDYSIAVTGTAPSLTRQALVTLNIFMNHFAVDAGSWSVDAVPGDTKTLPISTTLLRGVPDSLNLSISNLPAGVTASISPSTITTGQTATLTVNVSPSFSVYSGFLPDYFPSLIVKPSSEADETHALGMTLRIGPSFGFSTDLPFSLKIPAGSSMPITVHSHGVTNPPATVSVRSLADTLSMTPRTITAGDSFPVTLSVPATATVGSFAGAWITGKSTTGDQIVDFSVINYQVTAPGTNPAPSPSTSPAPAPSTSPSPAPSTQPTSAPSPKTGQITGLAGKCIGAAGGITINGAAVDLYSCIGSSTQQWTMATDGTIRNGGKCLDVASSGTTDGTKVQLFDCNGTSAQQWIDTTGRDLVNPHANKCLDLTGNSSADFTKVQIWTCAGTANQKWAVPA
jgi:Zn-dependent metalloprotease